MSYKIQQIEGRELGQRNSQADAQRMALYLTQQYGPLQILNPEDKPTAEVRYNEGRLEIARAS